MVRSRIPVVDAVTGLTFARAQMGISLAFHIVFAAAGVALPALMVLATCATGARAIPSTCCCRSGWPRGPASCSRSAPCRGRCCRSSWACCGRGSWGASANRSGCRSRWRGSRSSPRRSSWASTSTGASGCRRACTSRPGIVVAASGAASAAFVTLVNAFMNARPGTAARRHADVQPLAAMWSPSWAYAGGARAALLLPGDRVRDGGDPRASSCCAIRRATLHRKALALALPVACVTALAAAGVGRSLGEAPGGAQPLKLAAAEAHFAHGARARRCTSAAFPTSTTAEFHGALEMPCGAVAPGVRRPRRDGDRPGGVPARRMAARAGDAHRVPGHGRARDARWRWPAARGRCWLRCAGGGCPTGGAGCWAFALLGPLGFVALEAGGWSPSGGGSRGSCAA